MLFRPTGSSFDSLGTPLGYNTANLAAIDQLGAVFDEKILASVKAKFGEVYSNAVNRHKANDTYDLIRAYRRLLTWRNTVVRVGEASAQADYKTASDNFNTTFEGEPKFKDIKVFIIEAVEKGIEEEIRLGRRTQQPGEVSK